MKNNYIKLSLFTLLFCIFFLSSCITTSLNNDEVELLDSSPTFVTNKESLKEEKKYKKLIKKAPYEIIQIKENEDYLTTNISYPSFESYPILDIYIKNLIKSGWESFKASAKENWINISELNDYLLPPYEYYVTFKVTNLEDLISIYFEIYSFNGGAHGETTIKTVTYNIETETFLTITEATGLTYEEIAQGCRIQLYQSLIEDNKFEIDGATVILLDEMREEGTAPIAGNYETFTINDDKVTVYFAPTRVAPYNYGIQKVELNIR